MDVKFRPLLIVVALTGAATIIAQRLPSSEALIPLGLLLDSVPLGGVVVATVIATRRLRRAPVVLSRLLVAVYGYFAGALISALGAAHLAAVMMASVNRWRQQQFVYGFHFYSLVLLGVLLIATGLIAAIKTAHLARGHRADWRASLSVWAAILAINLPLTPLQGFAIAFSAFAVLALLLLGGIRRQFGAQSTGATGA